MREGPGKTQQKASEKFIWNTSADAEEEGCGEGGLGCTYAGEDGGVEKGAAGVKTKWVVKGLPLFSVFS